MVNTSSGEMVVLRSVAQQIESGIREQMGVTSQPYLKQSELEPLVIGRQRIVVGNNGTFIQSNRAWMEATIKVGECGLKLPFGDVSEQLTWKCSFISGVDLKRILDRFASQCPNEDAAFLVWNEYTHKWSIHFCDSADRSGGHIRYSVPELGEGDHLVLDIHSHGIHAAFFSGQDDLDDRGQTKISLVFGNLNSHPTIVVRLMVWGHVVELDAQSLPLDREALEFLLGFDMPSDSNQQGI